MERPSFLWHNCALVRISARRVWLELNSTYPWKSIYVKAFNALCC